MDSSAGAGSARGGGPFECGAFAPAARADALILPLEEEEREEEGEADEEEADANAGAGWSGGNCKAAGSSIIGADMAAMGWNECACSLRSFSPPSTVRREEAEVSVAATTGRGSFGGGGGGKAAATSGAEGDEAAGTREDTSTECDSKWSCAALVLHYRSLVKAKGWAGSSALFATGRSEGKAGQARGRNASGSAVSRGEARGGI